MSPAAARPSPYVGPRSIRTGERLYGRDREVERLFHLLLAERIVLLYSPSGAGKSSLLHAGLIPRLREEGFVVRPTARVGIEPPAGVPAGTNRHVLSALLGLEDDGHDANNLELAELAGHTLATYLARRRAAAGDADAAEVLLIDQFEEILTVAPTAVAAKQAFFAQLGEALRDERVWLVAAMREDFIAGLDPYRAAVPTALRTTFRLDLLGREAALAAIQGPAADAGVTFERAAADKLVDDLRQVRVPRIDGTIETQLGPHVEPVQLQVVCQSLWSQLGADERSIGPTHLKKVGDVDAALANYYDSQVAAAAGTSAVPERVLRLWIGRNLVTANGLRTQVLQTPRTTQGIANAALAALVDAHLLRTDTRRGMTWFELAHDRVVQPLLASNTGWFEARLSPMQRQAELWDSRGRPEGLLLATHEEAERLLAASEERSEVERAFLAESARVRAREAAARRNLRLLRILGIVVVALVVTGLSVGIVAIKVAGELALEAARAVAQHEEDLRKAAEEEQRLAEAKLTRQLVAQVALYREQQPELAALLGVAAAGRLEDPWQRKAALLNIGATAPHLVALLSSGTGAPLVRVASGHGRLFALDRGGQVWSLTLADREAAPVLPEGRRAVSVAAHPTEPLLAIGEAGATITLWDHAAGVARGSIELPGEDGARDAKAWVEGLAFAADGRSLLAVRRVPSLSVGFVVDLATRTPRRLGVLAPAMREAADLALSPDGATAVLCPGEPDGMIVVFAGAPFTRTVLRPTCEGPCPMHVARFSPSGAHLLTGGEGALAWWDVRGGAIVGSPRVIRLGAGEVVRSAMFMRDGKVAVSTDSQISLWDGETLAPWGTPIALPAGGARSLGEAGEQGERIAVVFEADAPVHVFDPRRLAPRGVAPVESLLPAYPFMHGRVLAAIDPSGSTLATSDYDTRAQVGRVSLFDASGAAPREVLPDLAGQQFVGMRFTGDGARLVVADAGGKVSAWDVAARTWTALGTMAAEQRRFTLAVDDGGGALMAVRADDGVYVGSSADGFAARTRIGDRVPAGVDFDRHGRRVALVSCAGEVRPGLCSDVAVEIYDVAGGAPQARLAADFAASQIVFSADGRRLAGIDWRDIGVWDLEAGRPIPLTVRRDLGAFSAIDLSADGRILAASAIARNAAADLVLWDLTTGEELAPPLRAHNPAVGGTPEGQVLLSDGLLVSGRCDGVVSWDIRDEAMRRRACAVAGRELTAAEQGRFFGARRLDQALCPDHEHSP